MNSNSEGTFSMSSSHTPDALVVAFDDDHAVANAGLALTVTLTERLGVEGWSTSWSTSATDRCAPARP
jgi:hypothetical protein